MRVLPGLRGLPLSSMLVAVGLLMLGTTVACGERGEQVAPVPTPSPPEEAATPPPGQVRVFLNTRPGASVDSQVLQEVSQVYSFLWPAFFNALANGDDAYLQGLAEPQAREALMARARLLMPGERLLVRTMRQRPLVMEAGGERVVIEDAVQVEAELLEEGQQPGMGKAVQENWAMRFVIGKTPAGWRVQEAQVRWQ